MTKSLRTVATFFAGIPAAPSVDPSNANVRDGEEVARRLSAALQEVGHSAQPPYAEYWGWVVEFQVADKAHWLGVGGRTAPAELLGDKADAHRSDETEADWVCFIERRRLLRTLFARASEREVTVEAAAAVHTALSTLTEVTGLSWHSKQRFDAGDESDGAATPT